MPANQRLINFIKEVRRRGYSDDEIIFPLIEHGWTQSEITEAINSLNKQQNRSKIKESKIIKAAKQGKEKVEIYLNKEIYEIIRKRSRKNIMSIPEQVEDIIRRSCASSKLKKTGSNEKLDDLLISIFSRKNTGPKRKN